MVELTPEERRKIYEEEKAKIEKSSASSWVNSLLIANIIAALFLSLLLTLQKRKVIPKIETFRKAYEGLPPE